jgi:hypothetical protein
MMQTLDTASKRLFAFVAIVGVLVVVFVVALSQGESPKRSVPLTTDGTVALPPVEVERIDRAVQADLRNALTAEKVNYVDTTHYTAETARLKTIEPLLNWNYSVGGVQVSVGDVVAGDRGVVCLQERPPMGSYLAIADIATGPRAGTYYSRSGCTIDIDTLAAWKGW